MPRHTSPAKSSTRTRRETAATSAPRAEEELSGYELIERRSHELQDERARGGFGTAQSPYDPTPLLHPHEQAPAAPPRDAARRAEPNRASRERVPKRGAAPSSDPQARAPARARGRKAR